MEFSVLYSARLILRKLREADDKAISAIRSSDLVNKYISRPKESTLEEAQAFIKKRKEAEEKVYYWAVVLIEKPEELIGTSCLFNFSEDGHSAEVGYELHPVWWGKGLAGEAVNAVMNFARTSLHLQILNAVVHKENIASLKLLVKNGFTFNPNKVDSSNPDFIFYSKVL